MKNYIIYFKGGSTLSSAQCQAYDLIDLENKLIDQELIEIASQFDELIIIEGEFIQNNPFKLKS